MGWRVGWGHRGWHRSWNPAGLRSANLQGDLLPPGVRVGDGGGGWPIEGCKGHPREHGKGWYLLMQREGRFTAPREMGREFPGPRPGKLGPWMERLGPLDETLHQVKGLLQVFPALTLGIRNNYSCPPPPLCPPHRPPSPCLPAAPRPPAHHPCSLPRPFAQLVPLPGTVASRGKGVKLFGSPKSHPLSHFTSTSKANSNSNQKATYADKSLEKLEN